MSAAGADTLSAAIVAAIVAELDDDTLDALIDRVVDRLDERTRSQTEPTPWLDVAGAARYIAGEPHRIYDLVSAGKLRCAKDGRRSLFRREWLDEYLIDGSTEP